MRVAYGVWRFKWKVTMDQLIYASHSHTHYYWYKVGMLKLPAIDKNTYYIHTYRHIQTYTFMPVLSTCPLRTNIGCGKERRILPGPW